MVVGRRAKPQTVRRVFQKWLISQVVFSVVRRVGSADTFSVAFDQAENRGGVTRGVLKTTNGFPVKLALLIAVKRARRCFSAWWEMPHISRVQTWICAFFDFNVGAHGSSVRVWCAHQLLRLWTVLFKWIQIAAALTTRMSLCSWSVHMQSSVRDPPPLRQVHHPWLKPPSDVRHSKVHLWNHETCLTGICSTASSLQPCLVQSRKNDFDCCRVTYRVR